MIRLDPVSYLSNVKHKDVAQLFSEQKEVPALLRMIIYLQMRDSSAGSAFCNPPRREDGTLLSPFPPRIFRAYYAIINNNHGGDGGGGGAGDTMSSVKNGQ